MGYESPQYRVTRRIDDIEIREYEPFLVAETTVDGSLETAGNRGFRILAGFIFGRNQQPESGMSAKIAMTTPVAQEPADDGFRLQFMMPSEYTEDTLPEPADARVTIRRQPARTLAAIRYSGRWTAEGYERRLDRLRSSLEAAGIRPAGEPIWARYDPPWKPWFLRRNEVLLEVN